MPRYATSPKAKRIEYRPPDFTGNIYLTLAGMLMAGLDGIRSQLDLTQHNLGPYDVNIEHESADFREKIACLPRTLYDALDALVADRAFLLEGGVFPAAFIDAWVAAKRTEETQAINVRPHTFEYALYLDC